MNVPSPLTNVQLGNAKFLLELVDGSDTQLRSVIRDTYTKYALSFSETLSFLIALGILQRDNNRIAPNAQYSKAMSAIKLGDREYTRFVIELALTSPTDYGRELRQFLLEFSASGKMLSMGPLGPSDRRYAVRDTLVSGGIATVSHQTGICALRPEYHGLIGIAHSECGLTPEKITDLDAVNRDIGQRAELAVMMYERSVVGGDYAQQVVHVSLHTASAGFDIVSLRANDDVLLESRLIEVKAVSHRDYGFYWSAGEIGAARRFGDSYFLYLVPIRSGEPILSELIILADPVRNLLDASDGWEAAPHGYRCRKRLGDDG